MKEGMKGEILLTVLDHACARALANPIDDETCILTFLCLRVGSVYVFKGGRGDDSIFLGAPPSDIPIFLCLIYTYIFTFYLSI